MKLYIIRHAEAVDAGTRGAASDWDRFLTPTGRLDATRLGKALDGLKAHPRLMLFSPLPRARETAELAASELDPAPVLQTEPALAPPGNATDLLAEIEGYHGGDVAIVGHEPFLGEFLQLVLNGVDAPPVPLSKASVACLELGPEETRLRWLLNQSVIRALLK